MAKQKQKEDVKRNPKTRPVNKPGRKANGHFDTGNLFWLQRSKHGRDKLFANSRLLWDAACEYFKWCIENPWIKKDFIKSGWSAGDIIKLETERPFTIQGLCTYIGCNCHYFDQFERSLSDKSDDESQSFADVISMIRQVIYQQKLEGAAIGAFNHNIIIRDIGLMEKQAEAPIIPTKLTVEVKHTGVPLSDNFNE